MVQVYSEPLCRRHYSSWISIATSLRVGVFLAAVAVSLVVAFVTGGFWVKMRTTEGQATVHFTHDALLLLEGTLPGQEQLWSTSPAINEQYAAYSVPATVEVAEDDYNYDRKPDVITIAARVQAAFRIHSVKAVVQFHYKFTGPSVRLSMYSFAYLAASSPIGGGVLHADGELMLNQRNIITERVFNGVYNYPMFNSTAAANVAAVQGSKQLELHNILKSYNERNITTDYIHDTVWMPGAGHGFELLMRVRIPPHQVVFVRPQWIEMLKFGWIQFVATYVVVGWILWWFQWFMFRYRLITTRVISDAQVKAVR